MNNLFGMGLLNDLIFYSPLFTPTDDRPPKLEFLMESIVNYGKSPAEKVSITNLSKNAKAKIFDFDYPLSANIIREDFEEMILDHFIQRRIGFQTYTAFKIQLKNKLKSIMPVYNKMFDSLKGWDVFNDGEIIERTTSDNRTTSQNSKNSSNVNQENDFRTSDMPQNRIQDIKDGSYMSEYQLNNSKNNGSSIGELNGTDKNTTTETIKRSPADKMALIKELQTNVESIYNMIYDDLECLFYQLI